MNSKENLDTCRTCLTCKHFTFLDSLLTGEVGYCSSKKEYRFPIKHCRRYEPAASDSAKPANQTPETE